MIRVVTRDFRRSLIHPAAAAAAHVFPQSVLRSFRITRRQQCETYRCDRICHRNYVVTRTGGKPMGSIVFQEKFEKAIPP